jgi:ATP-dependent RNA helicase RhlB
MGDAISFGCEEYAISLPDIENFIGHKIPVERYEPADLPTLQPAPYVPRDPDAPRRRGGGGGGGGGRGGGGGGRSGQRRGGPPRRR